MRLATAFAYLLPQRTLCVLVRHATRWRWRPWKDLLIRSVVRRYGVDLSEAETPDANAYPHFDAFFTRALRPGARPLDAAEDAIVCPADGRISQAGPVSAGHIIQAKGRRYTVAELLGDAAAAQRFVAGTAINVYLSPRDYHRVHMPCAGRLVETVHIPGRLFSVAPAMVEDVDRLFARNERLVCHFIGPDGPFVVVMVGALLVSGISTAWDGTVVPPYARRITRRRHDGPALQRGAEMARFHMGSTVIVLLPSGQADLDGPAAPGQAVRMGQRVARWQPRGT